MDVHTMPSMGCAHMTPEGYYEGRHNDECVKHEHAEHKEWSKIYDNIWRNQ